MKLDKKVMSRDSEPEEGEIKEPEEKMITLARKSMRLVDKIESEITNLRRLELFKYFF